MTDRYADRRQHTAASSPRDFAASLRTSELRPVNDPGHEAAAHADAVALAHDKHRLWLWRRKNTHHSGYARSPIRQVAPYGARAPDHFVERAEHIMHRIQVRRNPVMHQNPPHSFSYFNPRASPPPRRAQGTRPTTAGGQAAPALWTTRTGYGYRVPSLGPRPEPVPINDAAMYYARFPHFVESYYGNETTAQQQQQQQQQLSLPPRVNKEEIEAMTDSELGALIERQSAEVSGLKTPARGESKTQPPVQTHEQSVQAVPKQTRTHEQSVQASPVRAQTGTDPPTPPIPSPPPAPVPDPPSPARTIPASPSQRLVAQPPQDIVTQETTISVLRRQLARALSREDQLRRALLAIEDGEDVIVDTGVVPDLGASRIVVRGGARDAQFKDAVCNVLENLHQEVDTANAAWQQRVAAEQAEADAAYAAQAGAGAYAALVGQVDRLIAEAKAGWDVRSRIAEANAGGRGIHGALGSPARRLGAQAERSNFQHVSRKPVRGGLAAAAAARGAPMTAAELSGPALSLASADGAALMLPRSALPPGPSLPSSPARAERINGANNGNPFRAAPVSISRISVPSLQMNRRTGHLSVQ